MNIASQRQYARWPLAILLGLLFSFPALAHGYYGEGYWRPPHHHHRGYYGYGWQRPYYPPPPPRYMPAPPPPRYAPYPQQGMVAPPPPGWQQPRHLGWR
ncbi:MAG: hypothetical protein ACKN9T_10700 [Candidatus Methylumidiphilus sp.]